MKVVVIGGSGHSILYLPEKYMADRDFVAAVPGSVGESMDSVLARLTQAGYKPKVYTDYREMLSAEKPDIAIVDNYYGEHAGIILDAFAEGCHVLSDKPVAANLQELERVEAAWRKAGTVLPQCLLTATKVLFTVRGSWSGKGPSEKSV